MKKKTAILWDLVFVPFYLLTEFIPAIVFAIVMEKYGEE